MISNTYLIPPCSYQGGKQRLAKQIVDYIPINNDFTYYDLCSGSGAISLELINRGISPSNIKMVDLSPWSLFYKSIGESSFDLKLFKENYIDKIPEDITLIKSFMETLSKTDCNVDTVYKYILLQASSFGSKAIWISNNRFQNTTFRNYWTPTETSNRKSPVNPMMPMPTELFRRIELLVNNCVGLKSYNCDIDTFIDIEVFDNDSIIYIDPPYQNKCKYGFNMNLSEVLDKLLKINLKRIYVSEAIELENCNECIKLDFSSNKGGISGNRKEKLQECLSIFKRKYE